MKYIVKYEDFTNSQSTNEEINIKKALATAALGAGLAFGSPQDAKAQTKAPIEQTSKKDDPRNLWQKMTGKKVSTSRKTVTSDFKTTPHLKKLGIETAEDYVRYLVEEKGYKLNSMDSDTLHKIIHEQAPDTIVHVAKAEIDFGQKFVTKKYELSQESIDNIKKQIDSIRTEGGIITNYLIESSTDKESCDMKYKGKTGNDALAQRRADAIKDVLVSNGEDESLVTINTLPEQGPDLFNDSKYTNKEARELTAPFRSNTLTILFYELERSSPSQDTTTVDEIKTTWKLSKEYVSKGRKKWRPPFIHFGFPNTGSGVGNVKVCSEKRAKKFASFNKYFAQH